MIRQSTLLAMAAALCVTTALPIDTQLGEAKLPVGAVTSFYAALNAHDAAAATAQFSELLVGLFTQNGDPEHPGLGNVTTTTIVWLIFATMFTFVILTIIVALRATRSARRYLREVKELSNRGGSQPPELVVNDDGNDQDGLQFFNPQPCSLAFKNVGYYVEPAVGMCNYLRGHTQKPVCILDRSHNQ